LGNQDVHRRKIFYDNAVGFVNASEHRMQELLGLLIPKNPDKNLVKKNHELVKDMSLYLKDEWQIKYRRRRKRIEESQQRSENIGTERYWGEEQKDEVFYTHISQVNIEARQLEKFMRKWPNHNDEKILAETLTIREDYRRIEENYQFFIASCDTGFFSPMMIKGALSNIVTAEIKDRFNIICHVPKVIQWIVHPYSEDLETV